MLKPATLQLQFSSVFEMAEAGWGGPLMSLGLLFLSEAPPETAEAEAEGVTAAPAKRLLESTLYKEDVSLGRWYFLLGRLANVGTTLALRWINDHTSVWGSLYDLELKRWGYKCCNSDQFFGRLSWRYSGWASDCPEVKLWRRMPRAVLRKEPFAVCNSLLLIWIHLATPDAKASSFLHGLTMLNMSDVQISSAVPSSWGALLRKHLNPSPIPVTWTIRPTVKICSGASVNSVAVKGQERWGWHEPSNV